MRRPGSTLIEMIVTLAVMAVVASVVVVAARPAPRSADAEHRAILDDAARRALRLREPVTVAVAIDGRLSRATFFPDGSAVSDSNLRLDRLAGGLVHAR
jgi:hypothetical protein